VLNLTCAPPSDDAVAFVLLYPTTILEIETHLRRTPAPLRCDTSDGAFDQSDDVFFARQFIGGSCGTIAALHALINGIPDSDIPTNSPLRELGASVEDNSPTNHEPKAQSRRSRLIVENVQIQRAHEIAAAAAQRPKNAKVLRGQRQGRHYLTFVKGPDGALWAHVSRTQQ
jgi:hypothetical protein